MQVKNLVIEADDAYCVLEHALANKALLPEVTDKLKEAEAAFKAAGLFTQGAVANTLSERIRRIRSIVKSNELFS